MDAFIFVFIYLSVYFNWNETVLIAAESVLDYVGGPRAIVTRCLLRREEPAPAVVRGWRRKGPEPRDAGGRCEPEEESPSQPPEWALDTPSQ